MKKEKPYMLGIIIPGSMHKKLKKLAEYASRKQKRFISISSVVRKILKEKFDGPR